MGSAASTAYRLGQETSGSANVAAGIGGMASAAKGAAAGKMRETLGLGTAAQTGRNAAWRAGGTSAGSSSSAGGTSDGAPAWARQLRAEQTARHHRHVALQAIRDGDRGGAAANPNIEERD
jgi:type IV secretion system protein TrbL